MQTLRRRCLASVNLNPAVEINAKSPRRRDANRTGSVLSLCCSPPPVNEPNLRCPTKVLLLRVFASLRLCVNCCFQGQGTCRLQSARGLAQSKTLRVRRGRRNLRQLLDCASPLALFDDAAAADGLNGTPTVPSRFHGQAVIVSRRQGDHFRAFRNVWTS